MDSDRATRRSKIYDNLAQLDIDAYPLSAALSDLADYRKAGTAIQALTSIQQSAGANKDTASDEINNTDTAKKDAAKKAEAAKELKEKINLDDHSGGLARLFSIPNESAPPIRLRAGLRGSKGRNIDKQHEREGHEFHSCRYVAR